MIEGTKAVLIVGLGNPGKEYANNRHNVGFMALDRFARNINAHFEEDKYFDCERAKYREYMLIKPLTYVNNSGKAVKKIVDKEGSPLESIWVIQDDTEIPLGEVRVRFASTSGGHNGIKSIIEELGTDNFWRIRIGVGRPENQSFDLADYVLADFSTEEKEILNSVIDQVVTYLLKCLEERKIETTSFNINNNAKETTNNSN
jgi:PTH1 family peptidyl-tRNA hydrolase